MLSYSHSPVRQSLSPALSLAFCLFGFLLFMNDKSGAFKFPNWNQWPF